MKTTPALLKKYLASTITEAEKVVAKFDQRSKENRSYALAWADAYFQAVAVLHIHGDVAMKLEQGAEIDEIKKLVIDRAVQGAAMHGQSTSVCATYLNQCETRAWAQLADFILRYGAEL